MIHMFPDDQTEKMEWPEEGSTWEIEYAELWKPLLLTDGQFDEEKIKAELHDLVFVLHQVDTVYCHITGGKLSKPMYYADTIIREHDAITEAQRTLRFREIVNGGYVLITPDGDALFPWHGDRESITAEVESLEMTAKFITLEDQSRRTSGDLAK